MTSYLDRAWQERMSVRLDINYMLAHMIGPERGLTREEIEALAGRVKDAHRQIVGRSGKGADFLGFLDLPFQPASAVDAVQATADRLAALGDIQVVLGIGGSYLGSRAILE